MSLSHFLHKVADTYNQLITLAIKEYRNPVKVGFSTRINLIRKGFLSDKAVLYNTKDYKYNEYLSDYQRFVKSIKINNKYRLLLDQKVVFNHIMANYYQYLAQEFGEINEGKIQLYYQKRKAADIQSLVELIDKEKKIVIKPQEGGEGTGIMVIQTLQDKILVNKKEYTLIGFGKLIQQLDKCLITQYVHQADYSSQIYSETLNTIRILTMRNPESNETFIATAVHRFGSDASFPVDNWTNGGFSVSIDVDSGILGKAVTYPKKGKLNWLDKHPDTNSQIEGVTISNWEKVKTTILDIASNFPLCNYIGWDIAITKDNIKIIEGNSYSGVNIFQVHKPLLIDPKVKSFYKYYNVV